MKRFRVVRALAGVALAATLALPVVLLPIQVEAADVSVKADNYEFSPSYRKINRNDRVIFSNPANCQNCANHVVKFTNGPPVNEEISPGESTTVTFANLGTFYYHCTNHGAEGTGMAGTIEVVSGSTSSPTATATGTQTRTIYETPTRKPTKKATTKPTGSPTPSPTPTASPTPSPTPTPAPTPTPTESNVAAIPTIDDEPTASSGNTQALLAIIGVLGLGALGFLVFKKTLGSP